MSMRRFLFLPGLVELSAMGRNSPMPAADIRLGSMFPISTRNRRMRVARAAESSQLDSQRSVSLSLMGMLSVWP